MTTEKSPPNAKVNKILSILHVTIFIPSVTFPIYLASFIMHKSVAILSQRYTIGITCNGKDLKQLKIETTDLKASTSTNSV